MTNKQLKRVYDYMIQEMKNGLEISSWRTTEKSLIVFHEDGSKKTIALSKIL